MEMMEQGLEIQGVTAIEDKLQEGVPDALHNLRKAGLKVSLYGAQLRECSGRIFFCQSCEKYSGGVVVKTVEVRQFGGRDTSRYFASTQRVSIVNYVFEISS